MFSCRLARALSTGSAQNLDENDPNPMGLGRFNGFSIRCRKRDANRKLIEDLGACTRSLAVAESMEWVFSCRLARALSTRSAQNLDVNDPNPIALGRANIRRYTRYRERMLCTLHAHFCPRLFPVLSCRSGYACFVPVSVGR